VLDNSLIATIAVSNYSITISEADFKSYTPAIKAELSTNPTVFASDRNVFAQVDPHFNTTGAIEFFNSTNKLFTFFGYGPLIGEYVWLSDDHAQGQPGSTYLLLSKRSSNSNEVWSVDLYRLLPQSLQLVQTDLLTNFGTEELSTLSFKAGSIFWAASNQVFAMRVCPFTESYSSG
jgi:hypothetical protein